MPGMRRRIRSSLIVLVVVWLWDPLPATAAVTVPGGDFRGSEWGDSMDEVQLRESAPLHHRADDELAFTDDSLEGIEGGIVYVFERNRLVTALYVSRQAYPAGAGAFEDYETLRADLEEQLGPAAEESRRWIGERSEGDADDPAGAIAAGRLRVSTEWSLERTHVELLMTGSEDGGIFLRAVFKPSR